MPSKGMIGRKLASDDFNLESTFRLDPCHLTHISFASLFFSSEGALLPHLPRAMPLDVPDLSSFDATHRVLLISIATEPVRVLNRKLHFATPSGIDAMLLNSESGERAGERYARELTSRIRSSNAPTALNLVKIEN